MRNLWLLAASVLAIIALLTFMYFYSSYRFQPKNIYSRPTPLRYHYSGFSKHYTPAILAEQNTMNTAHVSNLTLIPDEVVSSVKLFVLFVGYPRSGHSIIGSLLDAHPNVVMAHQFNVLNWIRKAKLDFLKSQLFNELFRNSYNNRGRSHNKKGYNLTVDNSWQGSYRDRIDVIGDKSGGSNSKLYSEWPELFLQQYKKLQEVISIPIRFIYCVRNPYDIISTMALYHSKIYKTPNSTGPHISRLQNGTLVHETYKNDTMLSKLIEKQLGFADAVLELSPALIDRHSLLEVHNHELVSHPEQTILKLCQFLEISCSSNYVKLCASKVFPELSRTRFTVDWPEEAKKMLQDQIQKYPFFRQYSYNSTI